MRLCNTSTQTLLKQWLLTVSHSPVGQREGSDLGQVQRAPCHASLALQGEPVRLLMEEAAAGKGPRAPPAGSELTAGRGGQAGSLGW